MVTDELQMIPELANLHVAHNSVQHSLDVGPVTAFHKSLDPELPAIGWRVLTIVPRKDRQPARLVPETTDQPFSEDPGPDPSHQSSEGICPRLLDRWPVGLLLSPMHPTLEAV